MKEEHNPTCGDISTQLIRLTRLVALSVVEGKRQRDQIMILSRAGLDRHEIADILGTTPGTVSVELSILKKAKRKKSKAED